MSTPALTSPRYLVGSLLGSLAGAVVLLLAGDGGSWLEPKAIRVFFPLATFLALFLFAFFVVIGWPLFLLLRNTRWFRLPLAVGAGAAAGVVATFLLGGPSLDLVVLMFSGTGAFSVAVCWWFMSIRPNTSFKRDALKRAP
jgi:hypothetical protein